MAVLLAGLSWFAVSARNGSRSVQAKSAPPAISVAAAAARTGDLPIYLTGIGAVQASFTVKVVAYADNGTSKPLAGARLSGGGVSAVTNSRGVVQVKTHGTGTLKRRTSTATCIFALSEFVKAGWAETGAAPNPVKANNENTPADTDRIRMGNLRLQ